MIATSLPPEEIEGIRKMFGEMDDDKSGTISFEELREGEFMASCVLHCSTTAALFAHDNHHVDPSISSICQVYAARVPTLLTVSCKS